MAGPPKPHKILLVDDEPKLVQTVRSVLQDHGYEVCVAFDGEEALVRAEAEKPDLIILDITMPNMDGFSVLSRLRGQAEFAWTPVLMLTAKGDTKSMFSAEKLQATDYLIKPFNLEKMLALIRKNLHLR